MTTDNFAEAARAEAESWIGMDLDDHDNFVSGAVWARTHLAAQAPKPIPDESEMEVVGEWLVVRNAQEPEYPAGPEYGPYPYSDAAPLVHLTQVTGFLPELQEPTDAEVLAAAWAICRLQDDGNEPTEDHPCGACAESARAALSAARAARRDEEKR